jgi:hypothetical protein
MAPALEDRHSDDLSQAPKITPTFAGALNAHTTAAWASNSTKKASALTPPSPLKLSIPIGALDTLSTAFTSSPKVKELSSDDLSVAESDLSALLGSYETLRIYVSLDEMPFAFLDALDAQLRGGGSLKEIHICIASLLRPALRAIYESIGLKRGFTSTVRKWAGTNATLKFFSFSPLTEVSSGRVGCNKYQEVDLSMAVQLFANGSVELSEILALVEGKSLWTQAADSEAKVHGATGNEIMDLEE